MVLGAAVLCLLTEALLFAVWMSMDFFGGQLAREPQPGAHLAVALTEVASAALGIAGLTRLRGDRRAALRLFRAALLVDILVGQIFKFTMDQFAAVIELGIDLALLWVVSAFLAARTTVQSAARTAAQPAAQSAARTTVQPAARSAVPEVVPPVVSEAR
ncbi:hypothetical protein [Streptomyces sp. NPDC017988]|uniref:hypothetical protein n=1 Tax=Streptomyces sp. NPDC017988 TaxID=3365025 RepID=UPI0037BC8FB8